ALTKLRRRRISRRSCLRHTLHLQAAERIGGTGRARPQVLADACNFSLRGVAIDVCVKFVPPRIAGHYDAPCKFAASSSRMAFRARESRDITVPIGIPRVSPISW